MQVLPHLDLEVAAVEVDGDRGVRALSTAATAAPLAPVPDDIVSPTPRS